MQSVLTWQPPAPVPSRSFVYTAMRAHEQYGVQPFAFHATYSADKLMKLREEARSDAGLHTRRVRNS